jgi:hypothetical protein
MVYKYLGTLYFYIDSADCAFTENIKIYETKLFLSNREKNH